MSARLASSIFTPKPSLSSLLHASSSVCFCLASSLHLHLSPPPQPARAPEPTGVLGLTLYESFVLSCSNNYMATGTEELMMSLICLGLASPTRMKKFFEGRVVCFVPLLYLMISPSLVQSKSLLHTEGGDLYLSFHPCNHSTLCEVCSEDIC